MLYWKRDGHGKVEKLTNSTTGGPVFVYVQDGRIMRITPIEFDETDAPSWVIEARGRRFSPPRKTTLAPYSFAWRNGDLQEARRIWDGGLAEIQEYVYS